MSQKVAEKRLGQSSESKCLTFTCVARHLIYIYTYIICIYIASTTEFIRAGPENDQDYKWVADTITRVPEVDLCGLTVAKDIQSPRG